MPELSSVGGTIGCLEKDDNRLNEQGLFDCHERRWEESSHAFTRTSLEGAIIELTAIDDIQSYTRIVA